MVTDDENESYKTKKIIKEDVDKRTENEKHFILEDGTKVATIYSSNIHYKENGKFVDINNTLEAKVDSNETLHLKADEIKSEQNNKVLESNSILQQYKLKMDLEEQARETQIYENKLNSYKIKFTNKTREYNLGSMTSENSTITWRLKNANSTNIQVENPQSNINVTSGITLDELQINQLVSNINYFDILDNVDIQYTIEPEQVKEAIILNNEDATKNPIIFEYNVGNLEMKLNDNNDIIVYENKEDNVKFTIKAPFMYDNNLEFSNKIQLKLTKQDKKYQLELIPNKEWLEAENRTYPVTIDPTIQTSLFIEKINDTFIYEGDTNNTTRYQAHILRVGNGSLNDKPIRSLIKFSLPTLNSGDQVVAAELSLISYPDNSEWNPPTDERIFSAHKITSDWSSSTANWSNTNSKYDKTVAGYITYKYDSSNPEKDNRFDLTSLVKEWYTTGNNYGVMIKENVEKVTGSTSDAYFYSADTSSAYTNYRPSIIIAYRNQTGIEDYLSYHYQEIGRAGKVYTNDYNGNLTLIHSDAKTPGSRLPITLQHVYNTNEKDTDIGYGKGMRLNLSQTLELVTISSKEYLRYIDEDATAHYFIKNTSSNLYEDEDNLGLTAKTSGSNMIMSDKDGNTMTFVKYSSGNRWHLKEIKDANSNTITLTLNTYNNEYLISQISDAAGDKITLTYSSGKLTKIIDTAEKSTAYSYDSSNRLTTITYPDSKKSTYTYGSKNELTKITNIDNSYLTYSYYPGSVYRVKNITEYGTDASKGNSLTITYGNNLTKFSDNNGYSNTYGFDNYGHCVTIADFGNEDENIDNAYGKAYKYGTSGNTNNKLTLESKLISVKDIPNNLILNGTFEDDLSNWTPNDVCKNEKVTTINNNKVFKISGDPTQRKYIYQDISVSGNKR